MFDKDYPNRKDKRRPFRGAKAFCTSCRNNGKCGYCRSNRTHSNTKRILATSDKRGE